MQQGISKAESEKKMELSALFPDNSFWYPEPVMLAVTLKTTWKDLQMTWREINAQPVTSYSSFSHHLNKNTWQTLRQNHPTEPFPTLWPKEIMRDGKIPAVVSSLRKICNAVTDEWTMTERALSISLLCLRLDLQLHSSFLHWPPTHSPSSEAQRVFPSRSSLTVP